MWGAKGIRRGGIAALAVASLMVFGIGSAAQARSVKPPTVAPVQLAGYKGHWKLLVPMKLQLQISGREVEGKVKLNFPGGAWSRSWEALPHAGKVRTGDQRESFLYRHGIPVSARIAGAILRNRGRTSLSVSYGHEVPTAGDSQESVDASAVQKGVPRAGAALCETLPRFVIRPGTGRRITLPSCGRKLRWRVVEGPDRGTASVLVNQGVLVYRGGKGQRGSDDLTVEGLLRGKRVTRQNLQIRMAEGDPADVSVIAMGDSVTAGFGYFGATGKPMGITQLYECKPGATALNDACSSNSYNRKSSVGAKPNYLPDFGLARNISWAAQWANEHGITDYENYAVTGSAPTDWLPNGQFHSTLQTIQTSNPDYILMTLGANPLLSDVLFGIDNMGCALESDLFGDFRQCVLDAFETVDLDGNMNALFTELVQNTTSRIVVMEYPLSVPSSAIAYSAVQLEMMGELLNQVIGAEAAAVSTSRITQVAPPRFDVGIDMEPMYPSNYSCSFLGYKVDGPSVQATPTQDELEVDHPLSFCSGPAIGQPWVISGDTGIHPSIAGYSQMASRIPAPAS